MGYTPPTTYGGRRLPPLHAATGITHGRLADGELFGVALGAVDSVARHGLRHLATKRRRVRECGWRVVEAQTAVRAAAWLAVVFMAAGCTLEALSPVQAQQKRQCLETAEVTAEASRASDDAYNAAEGMMEGIVPTRRHQQLYSTFVEADERWRQAITHALALCDAAVADNSEDSELLEVHAMLLETVEAAETYDTVFDIREGCRWAREIGELPTWWQC